jgi:hypothetical protein
MDYQPVSPALQFIPLVVLSMALGIVAYLLARDKGRNVVLWTVLGVIPVVNFFCIWFFVGAANLRLERKVEQLLDGRPRL